MSTGGTYEGPERRESLEGEGRTTLSELTEVRRALSDLSGEVTKLTEQLEKVNTIEHKQEELEAGVTHQDEENRRHRRWSLVRGTAFAVLVLVGFGILIGLLINAVTSSDSTARQFKDYRTTSYSNCMIRNQQSAGQRVLIQTIRGLIPAGSASANELGALTKFLQTIPATVTCVKP